MKILVTLSILLSSKVAANLLVKRNEYLEHTLFKNADQDADENGCDDCCDKPVELKNGIKIKFYGKTYDKFWPCANGLISFNEEVGTYTPGKFPISNQPMVAAFWADVDLRTCQPAEQDHCSYHHVYYGDEAGFIDGIINDKYFTSAQFKAKLAIVQTWDRVGYFELQTGKTNTFQIVIVSDGGSNSFAVLSYGQLQWTTGSASQGRDGLGGIPAQAGFDAGNNNNYQAHNKSFTNDILQLANQNFYYEISDLKICPTGNRLINDECVPQSCSLPSGGKEFPIYDKANRLPGDEQYVKPPNVEVGECVNIKRDNSSALKVPSGESCPLKCVYNQDDGKKEYNTYQPENLGKTTRGDKTTDESEEAVTSRCVNQTWSDTAAEACVEVGLDVSIKDQGKNTWLRVREAKQTKLPSIIVKLKSKPYGRVWVLVYTSCKDGKQPTVKAPSAGSESDDKIRECKDQGPDKEPLASIYTTEGSTTKIFSQSIELRDDNWNTGVEVKFEGTDNKRKSDDGYENFKIFVQVDPKTRDPDQNFENCDNRGCGTKYPYGDYTKVEEIEGRLSDNERLELVSPNGVYETDENGRELALVIDPTVQLDNVTTYEGQQIKCESSNKQEVTVTHYQHEDGVKIPSGQDGYVTLTDKNLFVIVAGKGDNVVDGDKMVRITCELKSAEAGSLLPVSIKNLDTNYPGIIVDTTKVQNFREASSAKCSADPPSVPEMVDGCGVMEFGEKDGQETITVRLATQPLKNVVVKVRKDSNIANKVEILPSEGVTFTAENWDKPQTITFKGKFDCETCVDKENGKESKDEQGNLFLFVEGEVAIYVDKYATEDAGLSEGDGAEFGRVAGYRDCVALSEFAVVKTKETSKSAKSDSKTAGRRHLSPVSEPVTPQETDISCFSYTSAYVTGKNDVKPDKDQLTLIIRVRDQSTVDVQKVLEVTGVSIAIVGGVVGAVFAILAIVGLFVAMAIRKKRAEEHDRKEEMKEKADQAQNDIEFRVDADMEDAEMEDLETTTNKLLGERDELIEVNKKLADEVGESPMECATTEDQDVLIEQIKGLKGENDRLRDLQSQTAKRNPKKSKKKREGFGEQQV